jgi:superfamily I DNA/RNA helicase
MARRQRLGRQEAIRLASHRVGEVNDTHSQLMPRLILSRDFFGQFPELPKTVQKRVGDALEKFTLETKAGIHLEKPNAAADDRARTIRIDQFWRGVVIAPDAGDTYVLTAVLPHDKAYEWCERNVFAVNPATGAFEIQDLGAIEAVVSAVVGAPESGELFDRFPDKDLTALGIPHVLLPVVRNLETEEQLEALATVLPPAQAGALQMLASGYTMEEAYAELVADEKPGPIDPEDLAAALERPASRAMFYVVQSAADLIDALDKPLQLWRIFLHPSQRRLAYRKRFNGPVRVTGGAGTGKTVVAVHRARFLANQLPAAAGRRVLLTTFTTTLADNLRDALVSLAGPQSLDQVDVLTVDSLAHRIVRERGSKRIKAVGGEREGELWQSIVGAMALPVSSSLAQEEWTQVILAQGIRSRDDYLKAPRAGRGVRLNRAQRVAVWSAVEEVVKRLALQNGRTFLQLAAAAGDLLGASDNKPYDHVIVDEAQDLHPAQWRMLRAAVAETPNDLFVAGDAHQRIYDNRVTLSALGINVRGRSYRLRLNYRTTHEILAWALSLLAGERYDDLDAGTDTLAGYRSELHGPAPTIQGFASRVAEAEALASAVRAWMDGGVEPGSIAVAARTWAPLDNVRKALNAVGILAERIERGDRSTDHVALGTMHRLKGLEFRCVAVVDAGTGSVPLPQAVRLKADDPVGHQQDLQRERCLLYVACTRARDDLRVSWSGEPTPFLPGV